MNVIEVRIYEQRFRVVEPIEFFDNNKGKYALHDNFFGSFTIPWQFFLNQGRFKAGEDTWRLALQMAYNWEGKNPGSRIHKGTPYYFWGVTCILGGDLEKGFMLMHQALEEDKETDKTDTPKSPAYSFVTLDYQKQDQFFRPKVEEIKNFVEDKLNTYRSTRKGSLTLGEFKSKFLENVDLQEIVFLFVYESFHLKKVLVETDMRLRENVFSGLLQADTIFGLSRILDNLIKEKNPTQWKVIDHLTFLSSKSSLNLDNAKLRELNNAFQGSAFSSTIQEILTSQYTFKDGSKMLPIEEDLAVAYGFRNFGAHRIEDQPIVYQNFGEISQRVMNALFYSVEKLY